MREVLSTVSIKLRTIEAFKNQVAYVRHHRFGERSRQVKIACDNLDTSVRRLNELIPEVRRLQGLAKKGETVKQWRRALRNRSLRPLSYAAKAHLHIKLTAPHHEASNAAYVQAGEHFAQVLRPHLATLIAKGMDEDCLEVLENSTAKLKQWTTQQSSSARQLRQVAKGEKAEMANARALARTLHGAMLALSEDNPAILEGWNEARRIPGRIGQKRQVGGHAKAEARRAKPDRSPTGKPHDWNEPLEQAASDNASGEEDAD